MKLYFLLLLATAAYALKYSVVAIGGTSVSVRINGVDNVLMRKWADVPYFKGEVLSATTADTYKYVVDGVEEPFDRTWYACRTDSTYNDFFMKPDTIYQLDEFGYPFQEKQQWERNSGGRGIFEDDYISTVIFTGGQPVSDFFMEVANKTKRFGMTVAMINRDKEGYFSDVELNVEDTSQLKPKMKIDLPNNYEGRNNYKLRPSSEDPVFIRDKLYHDVLEAVGCPHGESGFARVFVNDRPLGLYHLQEPAGSKDFIKTQFYGVGEYRTKRPDPIGTYVDATTGADFAPDANLFAFKPGKDQSNTVLVGLIQALDQLDPSNTAQYDDFHARWFDVDYFFRAAALQYLMGHYDSYWFHTTNFVVYNDITEDTPNARKFYFIDQDFDQTYGVNLAPHYNPYGPEYTRQSYEIYVNANWSVDPWDAPRRVMIDKLLANQDYKNKFETVLKTLVTGIYNPAAMNRRIDSLLARLGPELEWDYTLGDLRAHQGRNDSDASHTHRWSVDDLRNGLTQSLMGNWGLKNFIQERSEFVREQFQLNFQDPVLTPPYVECANDEPSSTGAPTQTGTQTGVISGVVTGSVNPEDGNGAASFGISFITVAAAFFFALL